MYIMVWNDDGHWMWETEQCTPTFFWPGIEVLFTVKNCGKIGSSLVKLQRFFIWEVCEAHFY
jgi:hypothetical protein